MDTRLFPGIAVRVDLRQDVARSTWWSGRRYEAPTPQVLARWLNQGASHFFDVGANCGYFSYLAHASGAEVHAFEPRADLIQQLRAAKVVNTLERLHPHRLGLSDQTGELPLHYIESETSYSTFGPHPDLLRQTEPVQLMAFDEWRRQAGIELPSEPRWVAKIDVEGFEANVLRGMTESLRHKAFVGLAVELNAYTLAFCGSSIAEVTALLQETGYTMERTEGESRILNRFFVPNL
jgi:FkbM family methyltransferase